jgi:hypothetical protein
VCVHKDRRRRCDTRRRVAQRVDRTRAAKAARPRRANGQRRLDLRSGRHHRRIGEDGRRADSDVLTQAVAPLDRAWRRGAIRTAVLHSGPLHVTPSHWEVVDDGLVADARDPRRRAREADPTVRTHQQLGEAVAGVEGPTCAPQRGFSLGAAVHTSRSGRPGSRVAPLRRMLRNGRTGAPHGLVERELDARRSDVLVPHGHVGRGAAHRQPHRVRLPPEQALVAIARQVARQHGLVGKRAHVAAHADAIERCAVELCAAKSAREERARAEDDLRSVGHRKPRGRRRLKHGRGAAVLRARAQEAPARQVGAERIAVAEVLVVQVDLREAVAVVDVDRVRVDKVDVVGLPAHDVGTCWLAREAGPHARKVHDVVVVVRADGCTGRVELERTVVVEHVEADGKQLHDLAREVLPPQGVDRRSFSSAWERQSVRGPVAIPRRGSCRARQTRGCCGTRGRSPLRGGRGGRGHAGTRSLVGVRHAATADPSAARGEGHALAGLYETSRSTS